MEIDTSDSSLTKSYVYADAQPLAQHDYDAGTAGMYFYLHDRLGSVRMLIDDSGAVELTPPVFYLPDMIILR